MLSRIQIEGMIENSIHRFTDLKAAITNYYRTKGFNLNIVKYLMRESADIC
jgi:hypothetical protein